MEDVITRVRQIMSDLNQTKNAFAINVGINPSNFNRKMGGTIPFTKRDFGLIQKETGISSLWIETGLGEKYAPKEGLEQTQTASNNYAGAQQDNMLEAYKQLEKHTEHLEKEIEFLRALLLRQSPNPNMDNNSL